MTAEGPVVVETDGGDHLPFLGGSAVILKATGEHTDGTLAFYEYVSEPGVVGPPQHVHHAHDETFYIVEGEYEFTVGDQVFVMGRGAFMLLPRGVPHTFRTTGTMRSRMVGTFTPARFAEYFRELARIIRETGGPPPRDEWVKLYGRYDTTFVDG